MRESDLLVVGGGISGLFSAILAAQAGKKVCLLTHGSGILAIAGGTIDVLGKLPARCTSPFAAMHLLPKRHPYAMMGADAVHSALDAFLDLTKEADFPYIHNGAENMQVITSFGTIKPSYLVPESMDSRNLPEHVHVVGVQGLKDFNPDLLIRGLAGKPRFASKKFTSALLPQPFMTGRDLSVLDIARYMDTEAGHAWFLQNVQPCAGTALLVPPILGTRASMQTFSRIRKNLDCQICETAGLPPAITGLRLHHLFLRLLKKYDVDFIEHATVCSASFARHRCQLLTTANGRQYSAKAYIMATGGILGNGFCTSPARAWEPIFHLELAANPAKAGWTAPQLFASEHAFALLGPDVDQNFRPLAPDGELLCDNVFFVGKSLGGYDNAAEKSGNGTALATAWYAIKQMQKEYIL